MKGVLKDKYGVEVLVFMLFDDHLNKIWQKREHH